MNDVSIGFGWESAKRLSDRALVAELGRMSRAHREQTAELVAHLAELDDRKLYLRAATPSMFVYCVKRLGFSEDEACRRIDAARVARKWPWILGEIATGRLSLTVLGKLKPFLTKENASELVKAVSGMSVRDAERVLAARFPKPDVPDSIRKVPERGRAASGTSEANTPATNGSMSAVRPATGTAEGTTPRPKRGVDSEPTKTTQPDSGAEPGSATEAHGDRSGHGPRNGLGPRSRFGSGHRVI